MLGPGLSCSGCFYSFFSFFGGKFAIVKRDDARLDLVLVLAGPILLQAFAGEEQFSLGKVW